MKARAALFPIGREIDSSEGSKINELINLLKDHIDVIVLEPMFEEVDILTAIDEIKYSELSMIIIFAIHGNSARAIALASIKSGVPAVLWCHDEKHSLASSSIAAGMLEQLNYPYVIVHGNIDQVVKEIDNVARAALAKKSLEAARIGQLGPVHFNICNSAVNPIEIIKRFGTWIVPISISTLRKCINEITLEQVTEDFTKLKEIYDINVDSCTMKKAIAVKAALENIASRHKLDAIAIDCWNEVIPEFGINPCLEFASNKFIIGCEGDIVLALMMLAGKIISGRTGYCGDFFALDEINGIASLMHCTGCSELHEGKNNMKICMQDPPRSVNISGKLVVARPEFESSQGVILILHGRNLEKLHIRECEILGADYSNQMQLIIKISGNASSFRRELMGNHYMVFWGKAHRRLDIMG